MIISTYLESEGIMKIELDVPDYSPRTGLHMKWEEGFMIETRIEGGTTMIAANQAGLVSLARLILTLANTQVPAGHHWHLDASNSLEEGSSELIIVKAEEIAETDHLVE
jgi:hypothetical protein